MDDFFARNGNAISSVDLSGATFSQRAVDTIFFDLHQGGVLILDLSGADLSLVTSYTQLTTWDDLETLDLSFATLGSVEIDVFTDKLSGLNRLTISIDQWTDSSGMTQDALNTWDAMAGNSLSVMRDPDINGDEIAGLTDAALIQSTFGTAGDNATDLNTNGVTDRTDIVALLSAYGTGSQASPSPVAVPEPNCLALALLGLGTVFAARRRGRFTRQATSAYGSW